MNINGEVVKVKANSVVVKSSRLASCEACSNSGICNKKELEIEACNTLDLKVGDCVEVQLPQDGKALVALAYIFAVPVVILLLSAFLYTLKPFLAFVSIPLIVVYFIFLKVINKHYRSVNHVVKKIEKD